MVPIMTMMMKIRVSRMNDYGGDAPKPTLNEDTLTHEATHNDEQMPQNGSRGIIHTGDKDDEDEPHSSPAFSGGFA